MLKFHCIYSRGSFSDISFITNSFYRMFSNACIAICSFSWQVNSGLLLNRWTSCREVISRMVGCFVWCRNSIWLELIPTRHQRHIIPLWDTHLFVDWRAHGQVYVVVFTSWSISLVSQMVTSFGQIVSIVSILISSFENVSIWDDIWSPEQVKHLWSYSFNSPIYLWCVLIDLKINGMYVNYLKDLVPLELQNPGLLGGSVG